MKTISILFLLISCCCWGQNESANWYFGKNAGLSFNGGAPVALTDGVLVQEEGSASISDAAGNLLFYTDGVSVYDASHQQMPNGFGLFGDDSSTQSALILPQPGNSSRYYIVTAADQGGSEGLNYTVVDMGLNAGLGDVVAAEKNIQLDGFVAEKITATYHSNDQDIWVISHRLNSNEFIAYLITPAGIQTTPVVSAVGATYNAAMPGGTGALGYLKASPDGKKLASAVTYISPGLQLFDFDNQSGTVSNPLTINSFFSYGVEFSPDSKLLYCTVFSALAGKIYQYDISLPDLPAIQASQLIIAPEIKYGALQLAMDGKIYAAQPGFTSLSVIDKPNIAGPGCNFIPDGISLSGKESRMGLPPFLQNYFQYNIMVQHGCAGSPSQFELKSFGTPTMISWDFGDPASGAANTAQGLTPVHIFGLAGSYVVSATVTTPLGDTVTLTEEVTILSGALATSPGAVDLCAAPGSGTTAAIDLNAFTATILAGQDPQLYTIQYFRSQEDADAGLSPIPLSAAFQNEVNPQLIVAVVTNTATGCKAAASFTITVHAAPEPLANLPALHACSLEGSQGFSVFDLTGNQTEMLNGAPGLAVQYFTSQELASAGSSPIASPTTFTNTVQGMQTIFARVEASASGCFTVVQFEVVADPLPESLLDDAALCQDVETGEFRALVLDTGLAAGYGFAWTLNGNPVSAAAGLLTVDQPGIYQVEITDLATGCRITDQAVVVVSSSAVANAWVGDDFEDRQTIHVEVTGGSGVYEYRLDDGEFQDNALFTGHFSGEYTITVRDKNGCQELSLTVYALNYPRFFTPNDDGINDTWNIRSLYSQKSANIIIFDRYGKILGSVQPDGPGWDGTYNGARLPASDYWFRLEYHSRDGSLKEYKSHFSLLR